MTSPKPTRPPAEVGTDAAQEAATAGAPIWRPMLEHQPGDWMEGWSAGDWVLGWAPGWIVVTMAFVQIPPLGIRGWYVGDGKYITPTHWMPLPEPPAAVEVADRQARSAVAPDTASKT